MERMGKERPLIRYEKLSKEDLVDYCRVYWRRIHNDEVLFNEIYKDIESLKSDVRVYKSQRYAYKKKYLALLKANTELEEENKKLNEDYKVLGILNDEIRRVNENLREENKNLKEDVDYFRQCYLDLKKLCEKEGFMLSDEEVIEMFNLDKKK